MTLLELRNLRKDFRRLRAVDGVDLTLRAGETIGLVGESGCGKSTTARLITRLLEPSDGEIRYRGVDIGHLSERRLRPYRREIQLIFQDPYSSLNPRHTAGGIVGTALRTHRMVPRDQELGRIRELLAMVGLDPDDHDRYPHEFSGGQRQRIGIARAIAVQPRLIVADEPVSALDVSVQAQVINLLDRLRSELGISFVLISHDLAVVRHFCDRVAVMYLGRIVEQGPRDVLYEQPRHPYTQALLSAVPSVTPSGSARIRLRGDVPDPADPPSGCRFRTRCWKARDRCAAEEPPLLPTAPGLVTACHYP